MQVLMTQYPPLSIPLLLWDSDCDFCRYWIQRWKKITGRLIDYEPYQQAAKRFPDVNMEYFKRSVCLIEPDGTIYTGAEAVFHSLSSHRVADFFLNLYNRSSFFRSISEMGYRFVSRHRSFFYKLTKFFLVK